MSPGTSSRSITDTRTRGGFTLMELLTTMIVIGILGGIAIPYMQQAVHRAEARRIMTDVSAVRVAVMQYREDNNNSLPPTARWRTIPPGLEPYLNNVDFSYKNLQYRIRTNNRRGRVDFLVRYPRRDPIGVALRTFERRGRDSGSMTWNNRRSRFRLLNNNQ
jgi:prepilin-type N-terminal cleavage/methylation domain-containing protein